MKPELLVIKNIGPFRGTHTVDFTALGDIFLVYGKTGAGKTTIFDAISFAFYGKAPGGRNGIERSMRSHFAADGEEAAVALTFTTGPKRYRVTRTLAGEKTGARSGKTVQTLEESTLEEEVAGTWVSRSSTKKSETDQSILGIVKLSAEEFSRIVLLPQGEFARFLRLNSSERKDVLAKLFPIDRYTRVINLAKSRASAAESRIEEIESSALLLSKEFNAVSYPDDRASLARAGETLRERQTALRKRLADDSAALEKSRAAKALADRERELSAKLAILDGKRAGIDAKRIELALARKAEPLAVELASMADARTRLESSRGELDALTGERRELAATKERLASREGTMAERARERDALLVRKERLEAAVRIASSLESREAAFRAQKAEIDAEKKKIASIERSIAEYAARAKALDADIDSMDARSDAWERAKKEKDRLVTVRDLSSECERERKSCDAHRETVRLSEEAETLNRRDFAITKAELSSLAAEAERARDGEIAARLAASLSEGAPCPVCGSTSHPSPARAPSESGFGLSDRIDTLTRALERLEAEYSRIGKEKSARQANLATAEARLETLRGNPAFSGTVPSSDEAKAALDAAIRATQESYDAYARSQGALRESRDVRTASVREEAALPAVRERVSSLESSLSAIKAEIAHDAARFREAFPDGSAADPSDELEKCGALIIAVDAEISAYEAERASARDRLSGLDGKKGALEQAITALTTDIARAEVAFATKAREASFSDAASVLAAARGANDQRALESELSAFDRESESTKALLDRARADLSGSDGSGCDVLAESLAETERALEETGRSLEENSASLASLDSLKSRHAAIEAERAARSIEAGRLRRLADDLTGANPAKTSFDAWILGMYLEEIAAFANERLVRMSEGRYRIMLNGNYRKGNSLAGLELEVLDAHTGRARPTGTLSGGETFMTSISLALGLADSIQSRAGGIQLDAVFIDEGFGSLDESSLERAVGILDEIRGSRMVGIISHVGELRDRIPNRLEVVKTGAGSEIRADPAGDTQ